MKDVFPYRAPDDAAARFVTSISLHNACVAFHDERSTLRRAHIISYNPAFVSPLIMHTFSERALGYVRLTTARAAGDHERGARSMCQNAPLGLGERLPA